MCEGKAEALVGLLEMLRSWEGQTLPARFVWKREAVEVGQKRGREGTWAWAVVRVIHPCRHRGKKVWATYNRHAARRLTLRCQHPND